MNMIRHLLLFVLSASVVCGDVKYERPKEAEYQPGIPKGEVTRHEWKSKILTGTLRQYYVYIPAQYDGKNPAAVMVFQDGHGLLSEKSQYHVPAVFDSLIHSGEMPVTVGIFLNPGIVTDKIKGIQDWRMAKISNRVDEYNSLGPKYAEFLEKEILPEVGKKVLLTDDPEMRAIFGSSSGATCAFTVAWERPDLFRKVLSNIGSFTNIRGAHVYPALIRKEDKRPLRIFLQAGKNDLDNEHGNWWLSNLQMEKALKFRDYDYKFVGGEGAHNGNHGASIFPDSLRWLWRTK